METLLKEKIAYLYYELKMDFKEIKMFLSNNYDIKVSLNKIEKMIMEV